MCKNRELERLLQTYQVGSKSWDDNENKITKRVDAKVRETLFYLEFIANYSIGIELTRYCKCLYEFFTLLAQKMSSQKAQDFLFFTLLKQQWLCWGVYQWFW